MLPIPIAAVIGRAITTQPATPPTRPEQELRRERGARPWPNDTTESDGADPEAA